MINLLHSTEWRNKNNVLVLFLLLLVLVFGGFFVHILNVILAVEPKNILAQ